MRRIDLQEVIWDICCWCGSTVDAAADRVPVGAPLAFDDEEARLIGESVEFSADGYSIVAYLPEEGSELKEAGFDIAFTACSDECADRTIELVESMDSVQLRPLSEATVRLKMART